MSKWKCNNKDCYCGCVIDMNSSYVPAVCPVFNENKKTDWHPVDELVTNCNQLPKLTAEVFNRPDCPAWAKYAAVSKFGCLIFFEEKPVLGHNSFLPLYDNYTTKLYHNAHGRWDASDWQNSLLERPEKNTLPDWCKPGAWVWSDGKYHKIIETGQDWIRTAWDDRTGIWGMNILYQFSQARLRPYNAEEMRGLVGKMVTTDKGDASIVTDFDTSLDELCIYAEWYKNKELLNSAWQIDGKPCGVLERLENGEWVE